MSVTLQNCLDASSYYLWESGTPSTEVTKRTLFANQAKKNIRDLRNWTWELKDATPINIVNGTNNYPFATAAPDLKATQAIWTLKIIDQNNNSQFYNPVEEPAWDNITVNQLDDQVYWVKGNAVDGFTLYVNALPTANVTNGINPRYFAYEGDFVNTTDATRIPKEEAIGWYIAAKVLYGYREEAMYQLAMQEYQAALDDLSMFDQKTNPFTTETIQNLRQSAGQSTDFRTYF